MLKLLLTTLLAASLAAQDGPRDPVALRIEILRGAGVVHPTGSRTSMPIAVEITDQAGPSGTFSSGLTTEIVITGKDGRAAASKLRWNDTPGAVDVRLAAGKGQARADATVALELSKGGTSGGDGSNYYQNRNKLKTVLIVVATAAGSVATGLAVARK